MPIQIGTRLWVRPFLVERLWDEYQQQHILKIHLRWPTYKVRP